MILNETKPTFDKSASASKPEIWDYLDLGNFEHLHLIFRFSLSKRLENDWVCLAKFRKIVMVSDVSAETFETCFHLIFISFQTLVNDINEQAEQIESNLTSGHRFLQDARARLTPELRLSLASKMTSLELRWAKLQSECESRNRKLIVIQEMLTKLEESMRPFLVSLPVTYSGWLAQLLPGSGRGNGE